MGSGIIVPLSKLINSFHCPGRPKLAHGEHGGEYLVMNRGNEHREERLILASSTFRFGIFTYLYSFYSLINNLKIFHISISQMRSRSKAMINVRTISFYLGARSLPPAIKVLQQGKLNKVGGGGQAPVILISHPLVRPLPFLHKEETETFHPSEFNRVVGGLITPVQE